MGKKKQSYASFKGTLLSISTVVSHWKAKNTFASIKALFIE